MPTYLIARTPRLSGEVLVAPSKNAVLPLLAAALLTDDTVVLSHVPRLSDVDSMEKILRASGASVLKHGEGVAISGGATMSPDGADAEMRRMRASVLVLAPLVTRLKGSRIALPGGCAIGLRPIDLHLKGLGLMGAKGQVEGGFLSVTGELKGANIYLDFPSVGATENLLMAAVLAKGVTRIENAAKEPEITDLAGLLSKMGAHIRGAGTGSIQVEGVEKLHGAEWTPIPDRIEAGTFLCAAAITEGSILLKNARPDHLRAALHKLKETGMLIQEDKEGLWARGCARRAFEARTLSYPGFPTDLQALFSVVACRTEGVSAIVETIFENRFMHLAELSRMGADIHVEGRLALIKGGKPLSGALVHATDLRAAAALLLAGLLARGETTLLDDAGHLLRGYDGLDEKLAALGANIRRAEDGPETT